MSFQSRVMVTTTTITDASIIVRSQFQNQEIIDVIALPDATEDTDYAAKMVAHKNACKGQAPIATSPPITVTVPGQWVVSGNSNAGPATVDSNPAKLVVPVGNPGSITFHITQNDGTAAKYSKNGTTMTTFVEGTVLPVANGDTIVIEAVNLPATSKASALVGSVTDTNTGATVDVIRVSF